MIKQVIALILLSVAVTFTMSYSREAVQFLLAAHDWVSGILTDIFSADQAGNMAKNLIALLSIPLLAGLMPTLLYWAIRRHWFPYFMQVVWIVWLVQAGALVIMSQAV